jgi:hypothetical protein
MTTHIMLDIETLGTRPGAIALSAALVRFSDEAQCSINLSIADQKALGLVEDPATVDWWQQQPNEAWRAATNNAVPLVAGLQYLATWIAWASNSGDALVWCHGATFDCPLLDEVYRRAGIATPWPFWGVRDTRTLYDLAGVDPKAFAVPPPHVALNDALGQTRAANEALRILGKVRGI